MPAEEPNPLGETHDEYITATGGTAASLKGAVMHATIVLSADVTSKPQIITPKTGDPFISLSFDGATEHFSFVLPLHGAGSADYARQLAQQLDDIAEQLDQQLATAKEQPCA